MAPPSKDVIMAMRANPETASIPSRYDRHLKHVVKTVESQFGSALPSDELLGTLDPSIDTIPYACILDTILKAKVTPKSITESLYPGGALWRNLAAFVATYNPVEARYIGSRWRRLVAIFANTSKYPSNDIKPTSILELTASAIVRLDPLMKTYTQTTLSLLQICLETGHFEPALPVLAHEIGTFPVKTPTSPEKILLSQPSLPSSLFLGHHTGLAETPSLDEVHHYYIYGAMIYIGVHNWSRAAFLLEHVLGSPARDATTQLMLEAYKKWVLVRLLMRGSVPSSPPNSSQSSIKHVKSLAKPYDALVEDFEKTDGRKLLAEAHEGGQVWHQDGNTGLVHAVLQAHRRQSVISLGKVYAAMPVPFLASKLETPEDETEQYLRHLITSGEIRAGLNDGGWGAPLILRFFDETRLDSNPELAERQLGHALSNQTARIKQLADDIGEVNQRLSLTREYLEHHHKAQKKSSAQAMAEEETMGDMAIDQQGSDEEDMDNSMTDA